MSENSTTLIEEYRDGLKLDPSLKPFASAPKVKPTLADPPPFTTRWELVTPERARYLLSLRANEVVLPGGEVRGNRNLSPARVERYVKEMEGDWWMPTHQGIALDENGNLIDGQHRLWAIVMSGKPTTIMVCEGVDSRSFALIDQGLARSTSAFLTGAHAGPRAALARSVMRMLEVEADGTFLKSSNIVGPQYPVHLVLDFLDKNPDLVEYGIQYAPYASKLGRKIDGTSAGGILFGGFTAGPENWAEWFTRLGEAVDRKTGFEKGDPILGLVNCEESTGNMTAVNHLRSVIAAQYFREAKMLPQRAASITPRVEAAGIWVDLHGLGLKAWSRAAA